MVQPKGEGLCGLSPPTGGSEAEEAESSFTGGTNYFDFLPRFPLKARPS